MLGGKGENLEFEKLSHLLNLLDFQLLSQQVLSRVVVLHCTFTLLIAKYIPKSVLKTSQEITLHNKKYERQETAANNASCFVLIF